MTDTQSTLRVRLGPVARTLIQGAEANRQQALDDAIADLIDQRDEAREEIRAAPASGSDDLATVLTSLEAQRAAFKGLQEIVLSEMLATRMFIQSFMSDADVGVGMLREMTDLMLETLQKRTSHLKELDFDHLREKEREFAMLLQDQMGREPEELLSREGGDLEL
ncbi:hypothetical protein [Shimia sp. FJ5]|uniref:hypothetical protein n=1 Tax=Shimia sp. FJ5 TaxID=3079054 RepID=UPI00293DC015|nr:hypothetical protein [Shimia sp. FJ5]MDV4146458.1 hypothetical protein [Shimia sp. FJ5]